MHPIGVPERNLLVVERFEQLKAAVQPVPRPPGRVRRYLGSLLVAAGERLRREAALDHRAPLRAPGR
jgi:hypothetical protein